MGKKKDKASGSFDVDEVKKLLEDDEYEDDEDEEEDGQDSKDDDTDDIDDDPENDDDEDLDEDNDDTEDDDSMEDEDTDDEADDKDDEGDSEEDGQKISKDSSDKKSGQKKETDDKSIQKDKKTSAIIALKNQNKELLKRLNTLEQKQQEKDYDNRLSTLSKKYIADGKSEEEAKELAEAKVENERISDRLFDIEVERLEEKGYTDIRSKAAELKPLIKDGLLTLEQAYRAKYGDISKKEIQTKVEQLEALNKSKKKTKRAAVTSGSSRTEESVKLSKRDEKIFKSGEFRKSSLGGMSKKEFARLVKDFDD
jgi:hypothetical protein